MTKLPTNDVKQKPPKDSNKTQTYYQVGKKCSNPCRVPLSSSWVQLILTMQGTLFFKTFHPLLHYIKAKLTTFLVTIWLPSSKLPQHLPTSSLYPSIYPLDHFFLSKQVEPTCIIKAGKENLRKNQLPCHIPSTYPGRLNSHHNPRMK